MWHSLNSETFIIIKLLQTFVAHLLKSYGKCNLAVIRLNVTWKEGKRKLKIFRSNSLYYRSIRTIFQPPSRNLRIFLIVLRLLFPVQDMHDRNVFIA